MARYKEYRGFVEQIMHTDNFLLFKKMMIKKNKELEQETLEYMRSLGINFQDDEQRMIKSEISKLEYEKELEQMLYENIDDMDEQEVNEIKRAIELSKESHESYLKKQKDEQIQRQILIQKQ